MNLPNKLTTARIVLIPALIAVIMLSEYLIPRNIGYVTAAVLFVAISLTDYYDGKIARKRNIVTNFGKFLDPLADKLLIIGTMLALLYKNKGNIIRPYLFWALLVVVFRELMVTGLRLIAVKSSGEVIAANKLGKAKTVTQIVCIMTVLLEPVLQDIIEFFLRDSDTGYFLHDIFPLSLASIAVMTFFTVLSGVVYVVRHRRYLKQ